VTPSQFTGVIGRNLISRPRCPPMAVRCCSTSSVVLNRLYSVSMLGKGYILGNSSIYEYIYSAKPNSITVTSSGA